MRKQAQAVLKYLQRVGEDTDSNIGLTLDIPAPSVRRSVQELQDNGYPVSYLGSTGGYRLTREG